MAATTLGLLGVLAEPAGGALNTAAADEEAVVPASVAASPAPPNGDGFWFSSGVTASRPNRVVRMDPSTPQSVRDIVADVVGQINAASGLALRIGPDTTASPSTDEIVVRVPAQTICGPAADGCAANAVGMTEGYGVVVHALVEMRQTLLGSGYERAVLLHEFGHAMGLGHYADPYGGLMQVMWHSVTSDMTSYRRGDLNGLAALGAPLTNPRVTGNLDLVQQVPGGLRVVGWTFDPDEPTRPLDARVVVGGAATPVTASAPRPDVAAVYPAASDTHGIDVVVPTPRGSGPTTVCVDATGHAGVLMRVACRVVDIRHAPIGSLDSARQIGPGTVRVRGWTLDPDSGASIGTEVWVDGQRWATGTANLQRRDVGSAFPGYGDLHGIDATLRNLAPGVRRICVWGMDTTGTGNGIAGCRDVLVRSGDPWGSVDTVRTVGGIPTLAGWTIDPDTTEPVRVHLWEGTPWSGGRFVTAVTANSVRRDVGLANPGYGDNHGFVIPVSAVRPGVRQVCAFAINVGPGTTNPLLGCRTVAVP